MISEVTLTKPTENVYNIHVRVKKGSGNLLIFSLRMSFGTADGPGKSHIEEG